MAAIELCGANLKAKYREGKPKGKNRANYNGNTGKNRHKHVLLPLIHGIKRKIHVSRYQSVAGKRGAHKR